MTWYHVNKDAKGSQSHRRYIAKMVSSTPSIEKTKLLDFTVGEEKNCENKWGDKDYCNGPLKPGKKYRLVQSP